MPGTTFAEVVVVSIDDIILGNAAIEILRHNNHGNLRPQSTRSSSRIPIEQDFVTHTLRNNLNMAVCSAGEGSS